ncbi:MAG: hypothetical protein ACOYOR_05930 [Flavobacterium psychrophilum]
MKNKDLAVQNYKTFCSHEGSQYIASEFALEIILNLIQKFNVKSILELGLGIGSISDTVLQFSTINSHEIQYVGTEKDEFCLAALQKNVTDSNRIGLYPELSAIDQQTFDLIIIDGSDAALNDIVAHCKPHTIIFVEGDRSGQTQTVLELFPNHKYVDLITLNRHKPYAHIDKTHANSYVGGGKLIFIKPTFAMYLFWFQQKLATFIKRKLRKY